MLAGFRLYGKYHGETKKAVGRVMSVMLLVVSRILIIPLHEEHSHKTVTFCLGG